MEGRNLEDMERNRKKKRIFFVRNRMPQNQSTIKIEISIEIKKEDKEIKIKKLP